jgi:hypothetical protein
MKDWEDAMSEQERMDEAAITRALDRKPEVAVPVDFAARVRAALPAQPKVKARRSVGREVAMVATAGLVLALCVLAPHARPNFASVAFDLEMVLVVELMGVAAWLGTRRSDS